MHLASISSQEENDRLEKYVRESGMLIICYLSYHKNYIYTFMLYILHKYEPAVAQEALVCDDCKFDSHSRV